MKHNSIESVSRIIQRHLDEQKHNKYWLVKESKLSQNVVYPLMNDELSGVTFRNIQIISQVLNIDMNEFKFASLK